MKPVYALSALAIIILLGVGMFFFPKTLHFGDQATTDEPVTTNADVVNEPDDTPSNDTRRRTYKGTVTLPNPCYDLETEVLILESYPEQVKIELTSTEREEVCIQVIDEREFVFTVNVSERASIDVRLNGEPIDAHLEEIDVNSLKEE